MEITVNMERFAGLNFVFFTVFKSTVKVFREYKHLCLFTLNNEHFRPRQCESTVYLLENSDGLKP